MPAPSGRLSLSGAGVQDEPEVYGRLRAVKGVLRPRGWGAHPVAVQLELLPWSRTKSELGLFHGSRGWWTITERHHRAYLRAAHDILGVLGACLQGPPADWLSRLAWGPAQPSSVPPAERAYRAMMAGG